MKNNKKKIIFNGCSMTYGAESIHNGVDVHRDNFENSYPFLLGKKLKDVDIINLASCGKGNSQIFCHNIDYLFKNISDKDNLIFVTQWSWFSRFPKIVSVPHSDLDILEYDGKNLPWRDLDVPGDPRYEHPNHPSKIKVEWALLDNMSLSMILSYMNLLDNYDVKNVNYISQELDNVKFGPVFRESYDDDRKYNLNFIKKEILTHKNFLMDSWIDEFICKQSFFRKNNHASVEAHQLWANKLLKILRDKKYV